MEQQKINSCQSNCEEKNKTGGITLMDSSYKATVIKHSLAQKQTLKIDRTKWRAQKQTYTPTIN